MCRLLWKRYCENILKFRRSFEYLFLIFFMENLIGLNFIGMDWRFILWKIEVKVKIKMLLFLILNCLIFKWGVGCLKEDVDWFVDWI